MRVAAAGPCALVQPADHDIHAQQPDELADLMHRRDSRRILRMSGAPRILAIMGSGETAPTMAKVHRALLERFGPSRRRPRSLDTPYGFQENADEHQRPGASSTSRTSVG